MLKRRLYISILFAMAILSAQFTTAIGDEICEGKIKLTHSELTDLNEKINNFGNRVIRVKLQKIAATEIDADDRISYEGLHEMMNVLSNYNPKDEEEIYDLVDLVRVIIKIIMNHLSEFPSIALNLLLEDVANLLDDISQIVDDVRTIQNVPIAQAIPEIYYLFLDVQDLIYDLEEIPKNVSGVRDYVEEKLRLAARIVIKDTIEDTAEVVYEFVRPRLGYVAEFGEHICNTCITTQDFIDDATMKLDRAKAIFIDLPRAYYDLRNHPSRDTLRDFGYAVRGAYNDARAWYYDATDGEQELLDDIRIIWDNVTSMWIYYNQTPWKKPIEIRGRVINAPGESIIISFKEEEQDDVFVINGSAVSYTHLTLPTN